MASSINPETFQSLKEMEDPGSTAFVTDIANTYMKETAARFKAIWVAHAAGSADQMAKIAHAIKGSSLNVGADGLASRMQSIEREGKSGSITPQDSLRHAEEEFLNVKEELTALLAPTRP